MNQKTRAMIIFEKPKGRPPVVYRKRFNGSTMDRLRRDEIKHETWPMPELWLARLGLYLLSYRRNHTESYHREESFKHLDFVRRHYSLHGGDMNSDWLATVSVHGEIKFFDVSPQCKGGAA